MATQAQIDGWIDDLVTMERTRLCYEHPRRLHYGGGMLADIRKSAQNATSRLVRWDKLPPRDEIRRLAEGGLSSEQATAQAKAAAERSRLRMHLAKAAEGATVEQLRAALTALGVDPEAQS